VSLRAVLLVTAVAVMASACITAPSPDLPVPPIVQVDSVDVRAQQFGSNTREIVTNPVLDSKIHALFGPDWTLAPAARLRAPASSFFATGSPPRMLRTQEAEYVAVTGCGRPAAGCRACSSSFGLMPRCSSRGSTRAVSVTITDMARGSR
jgi:hypothetical protein